MSCSPARRRSSGRWPAQKPVIGVFTQPSVTTQDAYYLDGGIPSQLASVTYIAKTLNAKTVAVLGPNLPGVSAALGMFKQLFAVLGVNATVVLYPSSSTDVEAPIAAANAKSSDAIFLATSTTGECIAIAKAFTQLGITKPVVSLSDCTEQAVKSALGDYPKWSYVFTSPNPLAPHGPTFADGGLRRRHGRVQQPEPGEQWLRPARPFGTILTIAKWINQLGVRRPHLGGHRSLRPRPPSPARCSSATRTSSSACRRSPRSVRSGRSFYTYKGKGKFSETTGGKWICPPVPTCTS